MDCTVHGTLRARILEWVTFPFSRGSSQPGTEPRSPALQVDPLPAEPQGKQAPVYNIYIHIQQNHFAVSLKLTQNCKLTIF